ncbi:MAG: MBG domain-containing protein, partial [Marmoricola sp.]
TKAVLTVNVADKTKVYGDGNPTLTGTVTGIQNDDAITAAYATVADRTSGVGTYSITASAVGTDAALTNYTVTLVNGTLSVTKAPVTITADNASKVYGDANPVLSGTVTGVKNGDAVTGGYATVADRASGVGTYSITASAVGTDAALANYTVTLVNGTLSVNKAPVTITADNASKVYGDANQVLSGTVTGVKNGDAVTGGYATVADRTSGVGTYSITASAVGTDAALANYTVRLVNGTLSVTKAPVTITAADKSKVLGAANPTLTGTVVGVKNADSVTGEYSTTATPSSPVGDYPITASAVGTEAALANYDIKLVNGTLRVVYGWDGFLQPINDTAHQVGVYESKFKLGQTIPVKFTLKDASGNVVQQVGNPTFSRSDYLGVCDTNATLDSVPTVSADGGASFALNGSQYQYNWSTKTVKQAGEYRIFANLADGTSQSVNICLTK